MPRSRARSISGPIVLSALSILLTVALLIAWILVIRENLEVSNAIWSNRWLLAGGIISMAVVMCVLVMFSVSLVREILEGRRQQMFIDSVTHELKSPLASIRLCLDTLDRSGLSATQRDDLKKMMLTDVERLTVFVDDILQASRISHGLRTQMWTIVDVTQLLGSAIESIRGRYHLADDAFRLHAPSATRILTDPTALEIIVKNVLDNAVKYSSSAPQIDIDLQPLGADRLELRVRDQGIGIERTQLKRIFNRFHRAPGAEVRARSGSGLGLYVVHRLVRNLGGRIRAESAGPSKGTTMRIELPMGDVQPDSVGA
jgi:signal transduction histidine kinase